MLLIAGLAVVPAYADGAPGYSHHESPGLAGLTVAILLALAGMVFLTSRRWGRRGAFLALALLLAWFGLESAVHSVHHFWDPQSAASCPLFLASQHAQGAGTTPAITASPAETFQLSPTPGDEQLRPLQVLRSYDDRAPPVIPSV
jgi:hypothetical protein